MKNTDQRALIIIIWLWLGMINFPSRAKANGSFYNDDNHYRGFFWFEQRSESKTGEDKEEQAKKSLQQMTPELAEQRIKQRKEELDRARSIVLELGFSNADKEQLYQAVIKYKKLEAEMFEGSLRLAKAWEMANFLKPELADNISNPVNVPANRIKRAKEYQEMESDIKAFATEFDLVLFEQDGCPYCTEFKPVLISFAIKHGFSIEVSNLAGSGRGLAEKLSINAAPTLVAVRKDGKEAFEIVRGFATMSELEQNIALGVRLLKEQGKWLASK